MDRECLRRLREQARSAIEKAQNSVLDRVNQNRKPARYTVGDLVLVRNQDKRTYASRKWSPRYLGPFEVKQVLSPVIVKVENCKTGRTDLVHVNYVRPYFHASPPPSRQVSDDEGFEDDLPPSSATSSAPVTTFEISELPSPPSQPSQSDLLNPHDSHFTDVPPPVSEPSPVSTPSPQQTRRWSKWATRLAETVSRSGRRYCPNPQYYGEEYVSGLFDAP